MSPPTPSIWLRAGIALLCAVLLSLLLFSWINHMETVEKTKEANQTLISMAMGLFLPNLLTWPFSMINSINSALNSVLFGGLRLFAIWTILKVSWPLADVIGRWLDKKNMGVKPTKSTSGLLQKLITNSHLGKNFPSINSVISPYTMNQDPIAPINTPPEQEQHMQSNEKIGIAQQPQEQLIPKAESIPMQVSSKTTSAVSANQTIVENCFGIQGRLMDIYRLNGEEQRREQKSINAHVASICVAFAQQGTSMVDPVVRIVLEDTTRRLTLSGSIGSDSAAVLRQLLRL